MRHIILTSVSVLFLSVATVPAVFAQTPTLPTTQPSATTFSLTPNDLVSEAYQGLLTEQGIPSAGRLSAEYITGRITARDLVRAGILANRLPPDRLQDQSYLEAVNTALLELWQDN